MEDKNGLQILIGQSIKVLKIVYPLLIILLISYGIALITTVITTVITLPKLLAMMGQ